MPTSAAVLEQLTAIIVQVVGCEPEAVVPSARLHEDLEVDSLTIVEIAEALGLVFGIYIRDEDVNSMRTVGDAVDAVVDHDPSAKGPAHPTMAAAFTRGPHQEHQWSAAEVERRKRIAWRFAGWFVAVGIGLGAVLGFGGAALFNATIDDVVMPAPPTPTTTATTIAPTTKPTATSPSEEQKPEPTLSAANTSVSPGERIPLTGAFPELGSGATLQVQVKDADGPWDDFPVTTKTTGDGEFTLVIYTTRTGERQFRLFHEESNKPTPSVTINIG